jgi:hypothetical protein
MGRVTQALLDPAEGPSPERVPMRGLLHVPPAWGTDEISIRFEALDPVRSVLGCVAGLRPDGLGHVAFDAGLLPRGACTAVVEPLGWRLDVLLDEDVHDLRVPEPCDVEIEAVDADTLAPLAAASVEWCYLGESPSADWRLATEGRRGRYEFRAPCGRLALRISRQDGAMGETFVATADGRRLVLTRLDAAAPETE